MSLRLSGLAAVVLSIALAGSAAAQAPATLETIPLFPGLTLVSEERIEDDGMEMENLEREVYPYVSGVKRIYATTATAEAVFDFYHQRFGGKRKWTSDDDWQNFGPGGPSPMILKYIAHDFDPFDHPLTGRVITGDMQRQLLSAHRPATSDGEWVHDAGFSWVFRDRAGVPTDFHLKVIDEAVTGHWSGYTPRTVVEIYVTRYGPPEDEE